MTSRALDLLLPLARGSGAPLGAQIEEHLRSAIRSGALKPGAPLPSTRDLAAQLDVSRPLVVAAYEQLAAEGYVTSRQGARSFVAEFEARADPPPPEPEPAAPRYDFSPAVPDLAAFPRRPWLKAVEAAVSTMQPGDFGYDEPHGVSRLRNALAAYLSACAASPALAGPRRGHRRLHAGPVARVPGACGARRAAGRRRGPVARPTRGRRSLLGRLRARRRAGCPPRPDAARASTRGSTADAFVESRPRTSSRPAR